MLSSLFLVLCCGMMGYIILVNILRCYINEEPQFSIKLWVITPSSQQPGTLFSYMMQEKKGRGDTPLVMKTSVLGEIKPGSEILLNRLYNTLFLSCNVLYMIRCFFHNVEEIHYGKMNSYNLYLFILIKIWHI